MHLPVDFASTQTSSIPESKTPITKAMAWRFQEDWARDAGEGPRALMSLRVNFGPMG